MSLLILVKTEGTGAGIDITTAVYEKSFSVETQAVVNGVSGLTLRDDGTKFYITSSAADKALEYNFNGAYDLTSAAFSGGEKALQLQDTGAQDLAWASDGSKMFMLGGQNDRVYRYTPQSAWIVNSSMSYDSQFFHVGSQASNPQSVIFKPDGLKMFVLQSTGFIYTYTLSVAWDLTTASWDGAGSTKDVSTEEFACRGIFVPDNGEQLFLLGGGVGGRIFQYSVGTAWDLSTASYDSKMYTVAEDSIPTDLFISPDGSTLFVVGRGSTPDSIHQYTLG